MGLNDSLEMLSQLVLAATEPVPDGPDHEPDAGWVDVHFFYVSFPPLADEDPYGKELFLSLLDEASKHPGEFSSLPMDEMAKGLSYITWGGWIGDQGLALRMMALGAHYGVWKIMTPASIGTPPEMRDDLAGSGFVYTSGVTR